MITKSRVPMPSGVHNLSLYSTESETCEDTPRTDPNDTLDTTGTSERKLIKRRVLRRRDGHAEITDELTESEADDISCIGDRLNDLRLGPSDPRGRAQSVPPPNLPSHFDPYQRHHGEERPKSSRLDRVCH